MADTSPSLQPPFQQLHKAAPQPLSPCELGLAEARAGAAGLYNDLATLFLSNPDDTVKHIFSLGNLTPHAEVCQGDNCYFTLRSLAILSPAYLLLMAAGASLAIPGGLFMPSIMVGTWQRADP